MGKVNQSVRNIFRDSRENIALYYSQNIRLKIIHYTCCLKLSSVGKHLKKSMQQVLSLSICDYFIKICQKHRDSISHKERTVNVLGEDPTKITITNASIDKQITLKHVFIYKIENTDLEIGVEAFYYVYYSILKHTDISDRLVQFMR